MMYEELPFKSLLSKLHEYMGPQRGVQTNLSCPATSKLADKKAFPMDRMKQSQGKPKVFMGFNIYIKLKTELDF